MALYKPTVLSREHKDLVWVILTMWCLINPRCRKCSPTGWASAGPAGCRTSLWVIAFLPRLSWWPPLAPVQHSKAEGAKAVHVLDTNSPRWGNQITGCRHYTSRVATWHPWKRMWLLQKACLPPPDSCKEEGSCLTRSDGVGSCLLNMQLEINLITLEFFSKCIIRSRHRKYRIYHTGAD